MPPFHVCATIRISGLSIRDKYPAGGFYVVRRQKRETYLYQRNDAPCHSGRFPTAAADPCRASVLLPSKAFHCRHDCPLLDIDCRGCVYFRVSRQSVHAHFLASSDRTFSGIRTDHLFHVGPSPARSTQPCRREPVPESRRHSA